MINFGQEGDEDAEGALMGGRAELFALKLKLVYEAVRSSAANCAAKCG